MKSAYLSGALYGCLGLGVVDLAALNLLVLPTIHEEAEAIAASPPLVPVEAVEAPTLTASLAPTVVQLEPVARTPLIVVDFQRASQRVTHRAQQLLEAAAPLLGSSGQVTVVGHADATGSDDLNDRLSEERAHSVARRLFMLGVRAVRVRIEARGAREPRDDGSDRRVEVFLGDGP